MNLSLFDEEEYSSHPITINRTIIIEHYSLFYVHNLVQKLMTTYYFQLILREDVPIRNKTQYTSHYKYHQFIVDIKRNTDRNLEITASILPNAGREAAHDEIVSEKQQIQQIALEGILQNIQSHENDMLEFEQSSQLDIRQPSCTNDIY
jgi:hypothetical protein